MSAPLLVELFTEELPPKALKRLGDAFATTLRDELAKRNFLEPDCKLEMFATPRRLAARLSSVREKAPDEKRDERLVPEKVGLDANGKPTAALLKKLAGLGFSESIAGSIQKVSDGKITMLVLPRVVSGQSLDRGLTEALGIAIEELPIPKVMSYQLPGSHETVHFVRPAHGLVALHGGKVVNPVHALGLTAGRVTHGHRFLGKSDFELKTADEYEARLDDEGKVIAGFDTRRAKIETQLKQKAAELGSSLGDTGDEYQTLLDEVTALVEWPVIYVASFEPEFLQVPQECLILTMRTNQRYFPLFDATGKLTEKFLVVSNMEVADPKNIIDGNRRVVRPRLADAQFFYDQDRKIKLADRVDGLKKVVYHNKLGSQFERVERIQTLTGKIAEMIGADVELTKRAAWLSKADLLTGMVGEFPELQGIMGRYYAMHDGESQLVADAVAQHYLPRFAGDKLPDSPEACCVALADKLDTIVGIFGAGSVPTGDKDPFALRRHALGIVRILIEKKLNLGISPLVDATMETVPQNNLSDPLQIVGFIRDRAKTYFLEQGHTAAAVEAVLQPFGSTSWLHTLLEVVEEASRFLATEDGKNLAEANKRITNILKKSGFEVPIGFNPEHFKVKPNTNLFQSKAETEFWSALQNVGGQSLTLKKNQRFAESLRLLSQLGIPTKYFFDEVMVNVDDVSIRENRITLLQHARAYMNQVADLTLMAS